MPDHSSLCLETCCMPSQIITDSNQQWAQKAAGSQGQDGKQGPVKRKWQI